MPHSIYAHMNMHAFGEVPTPPIACSVPGWHLAQLSLFRWSTEPSRRPGQGSRLVPRTKPRCPVALRGGEDILQTHPRVPLVWRGARRHAAASATLYCAVVTYRSHVQTHRGSRGGPRPCLQLACGSMSA